MTNIENVCFYHITWSGYDIAGELIESDDCDDFYVYGHSPEEAVKGIEQEVRDSTGLIGDITLNVKSLTLAEVLSFKGTVLGEWMLNTLATDQQVRSILH
jgi:hypothetical protein